MATGTWFKSTVNGVLYPQPRAINTGFTDSIYADLTVERKDSTFRAPVQQHCEENSYRYYNNEMAGQVRDVDSSRTAAHHANTTTPSSGYNPLNHRNDAGVTGSDVNSLKNLYQDCQHSSDRIICSGQFTEVHKNAPFADYLNPQEHYRQLPNPNIINNNGNENTKDTSPPLPGGQHSSVLPRPDFPGNDSNSTRQQPRRHQQHEEKNMYTELQPQRGGVAQTSVASFLPNVSSTSGAVQSYHYPSPGCGTYNYGLFHDQRPGFSGFPTQSNASPAPYYSQTLPYASGFYSWPQSNDLTQDYATPHPFSLHGRIQSSISESKTPASYSGTAGPRVGPPPSCQPDLTGTLSANRGRYSGAENAMPAWTAKGSKNCQVVLYNGEMWSRFHAHTNEMIITKQGRRLFPVLHLMISGLDPEKRYRLYVDIMVADNHHWKFQGGKWVSCGTAESLPPEGLIYHHPDSPNTGAHWMKQDVSFGKLKVTNNKNSNQKHVILNSMRRYLPRIHIVEELDGKEGEVILTHPFKVTEFIAVTAYQNTDITSLKVKFNPYARGMQEKSRGGLDESPGHEESLSPAGVYGPGPHSTGAITASSSLAYNFGYSSGLLPVPFGSRVSPVMPTMAASVGHGVVKPDPAATPVISDNPDLFHRSYNSSGVYSEPKNQQNFLGLFSPHQPLNQPGSSNVAASPLCHQQPVFYHQDEHSSSGDKSSASVFGRSETSDPQAYQTQRMSHLGYERPDSLRIGDSTAFPQQTDSGSEQKVPDTEYSRDPVVSFQLMPNAQDTRSSRQFHHLSPRPGSSSELDSKKEESFVPVSFRHTMQTNYSQLNSHNTLQSHFHSPNFLSQQHPDQSSTEFRNDSSSQTSTSAAFSSCNQTSNLSFPHLASFVHHPFDHTGPRSEQLERDADKEFGQLQREAAKLSMDFMFKDVTTSSNFNSANTFTMESAGSLTRGTICSEDSPLQSAQGPRQVIGSGSAITTSIHNTRVTNCDSIQQVRNRGKTSFNATPQQLEIDYPKSQLRQDKDLTLQEKPQTDQEVGHANTKRIKMSSNELSTSYDNIAIKKTKMSPSAQFH